MLLHIDQKALDYLRENGNVLTIDHEIIEGSAGCCGASGAKVLTPKVYLGKPENVEQFKKIMPNEIEVYIHEELIPANYGKTIKVVYSKNLFWSKLEVLDMENVFTQEDN